MELSITTLHGEIIWRTGERRELLWQGQDIVNVILKIGIGHWPRVTLRHGDKKKSSLTDKSGDKRTMTVLREEMTIMNIVTIVDDGTNVDTGTNNQESINYC